MTKGARSLDNVTSLPAIRSRGRPKARSDEAERERIVAEARAIFLAAGYGGMTMDEVAARCGVSKRTLYRLFPAKTDLFRAMVAEHRRSSLALPRPPDEILPLAEALATIFRLDGPESERRDQLAFVSVILADSGRFGEIEEMLGQEAAQPARQLLAEWLRLQQSRGLLRADVPAESMARMLMDLVFSVLVRRFPGDEPLTSQERVREARLCIDVFLSGACSA
jgi:AcrR family transcriptional regulator